MLSPAPLFATPWIIACWAPLFMEFSRQEYWRRFPFPSPGDLSDRDRTRISCIGRGMDSLPSELPGKPKYVKIGSFQKDKSDAGSFYFSKPFFAESHRVLWTKQMLSSWVTLNILLTIISQVHLKSYLIQVSIYAHGISSIVLLWIWNTPICKKGRECFRVINKR